MIRETLKKFQNKDLSDAFVDPIKTNEIPKVLLEAMKAEKEDVNASEQLRNEDEKQYEQYREVLGEENVPETFDKFREMKYNGSGEYEDLKGFYSYKKSEPTAEFVHYKIYSDLRQEGIDNGKVLPPEKISASILKDETARRDPYHIMHRMKERQIADDEVRHYKDDALVMFSQWHGTRKAYYSRDGVSVITPNTYSWVFRTAWKKEDFDARSEKIIEVINRYVK